MIPRIIHQTWRTRLIPVRCLWWRFRLRRMHAHWEYRFYTDAQCRRIIADRFPHLLGIYDAYLHPVQRADMFRVAAVFLHGGFYCDLDIRIHRPLDELCAHACVLAEEKSQNDRQRATASGDPLRVDGDCPETAGCLRGNGWMRSVRFEMVASYWRVFGIRDLAESGRVGIIYFCTTSLAGRSIHRAEQ